MNRCDWCGRFAALTQPPLTFRNRLAETVTQMHCDSCRPAAELLAASNERHLDMLARFKTVLTGAVS